MKDTRIIIGEKIANNIRAERNRVNLTQEEVANKLDITLRTYISYEQNAKNVEAPMLLILANIFNCDISDFYLHLNFTICESARETQNNK